MFVIKASVQKELLEHIREAKTPKEAWDSFAARFSRANDARLQLLENEIGTLTQGSMPISQFLIKVKNICICNEISQQATAEKPISQTRAYVFQLPATQK
jgi:hypothetical protein